MLNHYWLTSCAYSHVFTKIASRLFCRCGCSDRTECDINMDQRVKRAAPIIPTPPWAVNRDPVNQPFSFEDVSGFRSVHCTLFVFLFYIIVYLTACSSFVLCSVLIHFIIFSSFMYYFDVQRVFSVDTFISFEGNDRIIDCYEIVLSTTFSCALFSLFIHV